MYSSACHIYIYSTSCSNLKESKKRLVISYFSALTLDLRLSDYEVFKALAISRTFF